MSLADLTPDPGTDYGEVFTRRWVVELILDLVGYRAEADLAAHTLVEPSPVRERSWFRSLSG